MVLTAPMPAERLVVNNLVGDVVVQADPEASEIRAEAIKTAEAPSQTAADNAVADILVALTVKQDEPGTVVASVDYPSTAAGHRYQVEWRITTPPDLALEINGDVGDVEVCGFVKETIAKIGVGNVMARSLPEGLHARTSVGDIRAEVGGRVDLRAEVGNIYLDLLEGTSGPVTVDGGVGNIQVRMPADRQGRLLARTELGGLDLRLEGVSMAALRHSDRHFDVELGGAAEPTASLATDVGNVVITTYPSEANSN